MAASRTLILACSVAGLVALAAASAYLLQKPAPQPAAAPARSAAPPAVETVTVGRQAMPEDVAAVGTLRARQSVMLRPEEAGRIAAIRFEEGRPVRAGEELVRLDDAVPRAQLQQAEAALALAEANYRRSEDLYGRQFISARARDEAAAALQVAQANLALARAQLDKTRLRAPFDGVVGMRRVSLGDYVEEGADLVNLEDLSVLTVDFRLPEALVQRVAVGQSLEVQSDALPGRSFAATIAAVDPLVDTQGRALVLRARLDNRDGALRPGLFARVRLILQERPQVTVVPETALLPAGGGHSVYRVVDGKALLTPVRAGARRGGWVEVAQGLEPGAQIVVAGHQRLRDGMAVRVLPAGSGAPSS